jgi:hypothetical protein
MILQFVMQNIEEQAVVGRNYGWQCAALCWFNGKWKSTDGLKRNFGAMVDRLIQASSVRFFALWRIPKGKVAVIADATTADFSVYAPDAALGLLLSRALSSGQVLSLLSSHDAVAGSASWDVARRRILASSSLRSRSA